MKPMVRVTDLNVILGDRPVLEGINFRISPGEAVGIIGPNGAGKTTLLRVLLGLIAPTSGEALVLGRPPASLRELRAQIGYMPQSRHFKRQFPLNVGDVTAMGLLSSKTLLRPFRKEERYRIREVLEEVGMAIYADRPFQELSGGEQQRVLLARALVRNPRLLMLDEPNAGLDSSAHRLFLDLLSRLRQERDLTIIKVSHDLVSIASFADTLLCINRTMHSHGCPREVLLSSRMKAVYRCQYDLLRSLGAEDRETE